MTSLKFITAGAVALLFAAGSVAGAQKTTTLPSGGGGSPHVKTEWTLGAANVSITYGRPSLKGRPEAMMMPLGKPWRTGADAASILTTNKSLKFGAVTLPPGSYTINTEPGESDWKLILGKLGAPDQWGIPYKPELELGRVPMKLSKTPATVEMVTFSIDPAKDGGTLRIEWGSKSASVPFTIVK